MSWLGKKRKFGQVKTFAYIYVMCHTDSRCSGRQKTVFNLNINQVRGSIFIIVLLLIVSCKTKKEKILINEKSDLWRVVQSGQHRSDSSLEFYKLNSNRNFNEIYFRNGEFKEEDSNPDIVDWHKWELVNDSIFEIGYIRLHIISLTDSVALFQNIKRPQDSLRLVRVKVRNEIVSDGRKY